MLSADASPPVDHAGLHRRDRAEEYFVRGVRKACGANRRRHHRSCSEVCAHLGVLPAWQHNPKWLGGDLGARLNARWVCKRSHDNKHGERTAVSASYATPPQITKARLPKNRQQECEIPNLFAFNFEKTCRQSCTSQNLESRHTSSANRPPSVS